jgi:hypothetical protein
VIKRSYYSDTISHFLESAPDEILGRLSTSNEFSLEFTQKNAWIEQIKILKQTLCDYSGSIYFEYAIPRMGKRIDILLIIQNVIFVLEFKIGEKEYAGYAVDQVYDYCLDLKNFHETSHTPIIAPILIATNAPESIWSVGTTSHNDNLLFPIRTNSCHLGEVIRSVLQFADGESIDSDFWEKGRYSPTPTIIEAAMALYSGHSVTDIIRNEAENMGRTTETVSCLIEHAKENNEKVICFVTGVPGSGKTLVGLDVATKHFVKEHGSTSVFLSGNGPLVAILREALTRDRVAREKENGKKVRKGEVMSQVKVFIQNVHNFRDECLIDPTSPPYDHVAIFDEAQRAWDHTQTANFMIRKKNIPNFSISEPEYLISCLDRHEDWAVIVCLVGGGQEINTGEAGISEWIYSLNRSYPDWHVYISDRLSDSEYAAGHALEILKQHKNVFVKEELHLAVSLRSFRAENLSLLVKNLLDLEEEQARNNYQKLKNNYPIVITRDLSKAKRWLKGQARGSERYGILVSSQAQRLKPHAIDVRSPVDPIHWFLDGKEDVRSSYYLEDVVTEFQVQGLELDWACITWDADFRYSEEGWESYSFVGDKWHNIRKEERKMYLKNAYRVLLTRARQGMVIVVPEGDKEDHTRSEIYYNATFSYLKGIGLIEL